MRSSKKHKVLRVVFIVLLSVLFLWAGTYDAMAQAAAVATVGQMTSITWASAGISFAGLLVYLQYAKWFVAGLGWPALAAIAAQFLAGYVITHWDDTYRPYLAAWLGTANYRKVTGGFELNVPLNVLPSLQEATINAGTFSCPSCSPVGTRYDSGSYGSQALAVAAKNAMVSGSGGTIENLGDFLGELHMSDNTHLLYCGAFRRPGTGWKYYHFFWATTAAGAAIAVTQVDQWESAPPASVVTTLVTHAGQSTPSVATKDALKEVINEVAASLPIVGGIADIVPVAVPGPDPGKTARQKVTEAVVAQVPSGEAPPWTTLPAGGLVVTPIVPPAADVLPYTDPGYSGAFNGAAWPTSPSIGLVFTDFVAELKTTNFWGLPGYMSSGFPSGGNPVISFDGGVFGQHTYDFSSWGSALFNTIKGIVLVICSWVAIKIATKGGGG